MSNLCGTTTFCCGDDGDKDVLMDSSGAAPVGLKTGDLALPEPPSKTAETVAAKEVARNMPATDFIVEVEKKGPDSKVGLDVDHGDDVTLEIMLVKDGLVKDYNNSVAQDLQIRPGDRIVEVNGVSGDNKKMLEAVGKAAKLKFIVRHTTA
mmetsp:Transcript_90579/g.157199  ORF Transcript_90579/g.157199 Transcript_90579/m.157199 type:complete len:151 (+) Transcript_90579:56-508(+)